MPFIRERLALRAPGGTDIVRIVMGLLLLVGLVMAAPRSVAAPTINVSPASVLPGDALAVSWSGISSPRRHDWVGLYTSGAADFAYRSYAFTNGGASGTLTFSLPSKLPAGSYELRLFSSGAYRRIAVSDTFNVRNPAPRPPSPAATLSVTPETVGAGEAVTATWTDVAGAAPNDWIGLFKPNASDKAFRSYVYTTGAGTGTVAFPIPPRLAKGSYELRLFANGSFTRLVVSNRFTVADRVSQPPATISLTANPASVVTGGTITAAWNGLGTPASSDWIGLFLRDAPDSAYLVRQNTGGAATGNAAIMVPAALGAGVYHLRLFGGSGARLATSNDINISRPAASVTLAASPTSVAVGATVTAAWAGIPAPAAGDWIGLFQTGASDSVYVARGETAGAAGGSVPITVPLNASTGSYELRLFAADGSARLAVSNALTVTPAPEAQIYFIHTDHLNTPRVITNAAGKAVWRWDNMDPFGMNAPDENPSGLGTFTCNLRFPGQYFDRETNLHYNYFRDYDAALGRYIQSDPIGLDGGMNTYLYVDGNPITAIDPFGLMGQGAGASNKMGPLRTPSQCGTGKVLRGPEFSFRLACIEHDKCFETCGKQKSDCDDAFCAAAKRSCAPGDFSCTAQAAFYCSVVQSTPASLAYDPAQAVACKNKCKRY